MNWRGRPLTSHDVIVQSIAATTTGTGQYPTGLKVDDKEIAALPITRHRFHGDWNYTLQPTNSQALGLQDARKPDHDARDRCGQPLGCAVNRRPARGGRRTAGAFTAANTTSVPASSDVALFPLDASEADFGPDALAARRATDEP